MIKHWVQLKDYTYCAVKCIMKSNVSDGFTAFVYSVVQLLCAYINMYSLQVLMVSTQSP